MTSATKQQGHFENVKGCSKWLCPNKLKLSWAARLRRHPSPLHLGKTCITLKPPPPPHPPPAESASQTASLFWPSEEERRADTALLRAWGNLSCRWKKYNLRAPREYKLFFLTKKPTNQKTPKPTSHNDYILMLFVTSMRGARMGCRAGKGNHFPSEAEYGLVPPLQNS